MKLITEIAMQKKGEIWCTRDLCESPKYKITETAIQGLEDNLKDLLNNTRGADKILFELEGAYLDYSSIVGEENFLRGFMEGVKFITQLKGELKDIEKEQPAVTDCPRVQIK